MALQVQYTDAHGVTHSAAYGRVNYYAVRREVGQAAQISYVVEVYASDSARRDRRRPLAHVEGQMEYDDQGPIRLADIYAHSKTLPEFAGAADV